MIKKRIVRKSKPRLNIGDKYCYKEFGPKGNILTIIAESPKPGYLDYHMYFVEITMPEGKTTYTALSAHDIIKERSLFEKLKTK